MTTRRVRFDDSFYDMAQEAFGERTDDGRPSYNDFLERGIPALRFELMRSHQLQAALPDRAFVAKLANHAVMPPMTAYAIIEDDAEANLETLDVYILRVDWAAWERARNDYGENDW